MKFEHCQIKFICLYKYYYLPGGVSSDKGVGTPSVGSAQLKITSEYSRVPISSAGPSIREKRFFRFYRGKHAGPNTEDRRKRCGIEKTVHGGETRAIRAGRPAKMAEQRN